jgi:exosortase
MVAVLTAGVGALYADVLVRLWSDWLTDANYSHGILVPPAVAWLIWRRRDELRALPLAPSHAGLAIVAASLVLFLFGQAALEFFVTRLSFLGLLGGAVVTLAGWSHLRVCLFPLMLLAIAIPLPSLLFNQVAFPMQLLASRLGVATLEAFTIPAVREGNVILLENATLEVAEACSGVRSLISLGTLALFYGYATHQHPASRGLVALAVIPVVLIANGLRVAAAGVVAHAYGPDAAAGFLHSFSGWLFFGSAVLLLIAVDRGVAAMGWSGSGRPRSARAA